ncbi:MFS siderochrome iron transporter 1 [Penicillium manginii]|uniref:MFS siderochrome iron transporter 1 n=1 Tax=Penicillium manginii TaxID=203109 RepID=UPI0025492075|nr:MFS siderochrome iron transporter 1 [Penicillium manginii]KAJ5740071.1 MFS siderochrome iron transporter 1 [Penicillium manginii]
MCNGNGVPTLQLFHPHLLADQRCKLQWGSLSQTYRNYAIQAVCGIQASITGGFTLEMKRVGRKGTGAIAYICTRVFLFLFTKANTPASVLGFSCVIAFLQNLLQSAVLEMVGLMAPIIAAYVGVETSMPIWISAVLFVVTGIVFLALPYEMRGRAAA